MCVCVVGGWSDLVFVCVLDNTSQSPDDAHQDYTMSQAKKIFNKYIRFGSKAEVLDVT